MKTKAQQPEGTERIPPSEKSSASLDEGSPTFECVYTGMPSEAGATAFLGGLPRRFGGTNGIGATR